MEPTARPRDPHLRDRRATRQVRPPAPAPLAPRGLAAAQIDRALDTQQSVLVAVKVARAGTRLVELGWAVRAGTVPVELVPPALRGRRPRHEPRVTLPAQPNVVVRHVVVDDSVRPMRRCEYGQSIAVRTARDAVALLSQELCELHELVTMGFFHPVLIVVQDRRAMDDVTDLLRHGLELPPSWDGAQLDGAPFSINLHDYSVSLDRHLDGMPLPGLLDHLVRKYAGKRAMATPLNRHRIDLACAGNTAYLTLCALIDVHACLHCSGDDEHDDASNSEGSSPVAGLSEEDSMFDNLPAI